jgi:hypothetical protein
MMSLPIAAGRAIKALATRASRERQAGCGPSPPSRTKPAKDQRVRCRHRSSYLLTKSGHLQSAEEKHPTTLPQAHAKMAPNPSRITVFVLWLREE